MIEKFRKFSNSFFAKIFLFIVAIPFVFWGMGDLFSGGNQKTIVEIDDDKISTQEFINYVNSRAGSLNKIDDEILQNLLSSFIGQKLIEQEVEEYGIILPEKSLAKIIKNQKIFKKENKFSRTEYERFLVKNNLNHVVFEKNISNQEEKNQLMDFIGGGILPSNFMVNIEYNKINQERIIKLINLNIVLEKKLKLSESQINEYFENNKDLYKTIYKSIKFSKINPKILTGKNEFSDLFFKKIDNIDDLIVEGETIENISKEYNLESISYATFNESGKDKNLKDINLSDKIITKVYNISESEPVVLVEDKDNYFLIELVKTENIEKNLNDNKVRELVVTNLKNKIKRNYITDLVTKINNNDFDKKDFENISKNNNIKIKEISIKNINDESNLKKDLISQIYLYPQNKVVIATDIGLNESYLVYIKKINNVSIKENSDEYAKYTNLSKARMKNYLYNTYETYLKGKYKVDINYSALENVKNYF